MTTAEDIRNSIKKGGAFYKESRIEDVFYERFVLLRKKIHKVLDEKFEDPLDFEVYINSILVDVRALFLENDKRNFNSTIQNTYQIRRMKEYADKVDELFNKKMNDNQTLKEIIKKWVDKRIVHIDYLEADEEENSFENILSILDRKSLNSLFLKIFEISIQYEEFRESYGSNKRKSVDRVLNAMTD